TGVRSTTNTTTEPTPPWSWPLRRSPQSEGIDTYAVPYIVGEIKRLFRDTSWAVHVPRRLQELRNEIVRCKEEFAVDLGREPTVQELAEQLKLSEEEIREGLVASNGYTASSLDIPVDGAEGTGSSDSPSLADFLGAEDPELEKVENLHTLAPLMRTLDERERRIIDMRFGLEMTQSEIGAELGISQMHVSRLLSRILRKLRTGMAGEDGVTAPSAA
ncbi:sigma-70 family RNA polymerase sigma factor, partial [Streptomyces sp. NPDC051643]|uniref:sigma-70 family RNA polymerase sigma factor n=1 Tax=Streptomyces sp. NPDC051643 TaxID=3365665 RepID=UPI0037B895F0